MGVTYVKAGGAMAFTDVASATTGGAVADLPNHGITVLSGTTAETYTLQPPYLGARKTIVRLSTSSAAGTQTIRGSTATSVKFQIAATHATQIVFLGTSTEDQVVELLGINSTRWVVMSKGPISASTPGPTIGSSA